MSVPKTKPTEVSAETHIAAIANEEQRTDAQSLVVLMRKVTKQEPRMWGPSIVGFGSYHYKYASGHEGDSALTGFAAGKGVGCLHRAGLRRSGRLVSQAGRAQDWEGMCLHQAPGQRRSEGPGEVGSSIGSRHEESLSAAE